MDKPRAKSAIAFGPETPVQFSIFSLADKKLVREVLKKIEEFGKVETSLIGGGWWLYIKPNYDVEEVKKYIESL